MNGPSLLRRSPTGLCLLQALAVYCLTVCWQTAVWAQDQPSFELNARAGAELPQNAVIEVRLSDDTELNLQLRESVIAELKRNGHQVAAQNASVVLWLESKFIDHSHEKADSIGQFRAGSTLGGPVGALNDPDKTQMDVNVKVWSSSKNSLLRREGGSGTIQRGFEVTLNAYNEARGQHIWRGAIRTEDTQGDAAYIGRKMVPPLVSALGENVENRTIQMD